PAAPPGDRYASLRSHNPRMGPTAAHRPGAGRHRMRSRTIREGGHASGSVIGSQGWLVRTPRRMAVQLGQQGDGGVRGRMWVVAPPDHLHGDRRGVAQRPEDDAVTPVLGRGAFRGDADAATGRDDREPVVNVASVPNAGLAAGWPQVRGGGP